MTLATNPPAEKSGNHRHPWLVLTFLCISVFVLAIDNTILDLALPPISRDLGASTGDLQWIINAYVLAYAAPLLAIGAVVDRVGRKRMLQIGLILFALLSILAAMSVSTTMLIVSRALLGMAGAMVVPSTLAILAATFEEPKARAQAIGIWAGVWGLGSGLGPVTGGYLLEHFEWNAVFYLNIPIALIALIGGYFVITESRETSTTRPDLFGVALSMTGLFTLVYGIVSAGEHGWGSATVIWSLAAGAILLATFALWESRSAHPMLPMGFFGNPSFTAANIALALAMFGFMGGLFAFSQYFQSVQGYSPLAAGLRMLPGTAVFFVGAALAPRIARVTGIKLAVAAGMLIAGGGLFYMSQIAAADTSYGRLVGGLVLLAAGLGIAYSPAVDSVIGSLPPSRAGIGSAMDETSQQVGAALGVAILGAVINATYRAEVSDMEIIAALPPEAHETAAGSIQGAHILAEEFPPDVSQEIVNGCNEAFTSGMTDAMFVGAIIIGVTAVVSLLTLPARIRRLE